LNESTRSGEEDKKFTNGKTVMAQSEIERLNLQIPLSLNILSLTCNNDFSNLTSKTLPDLKINFEFETSDEETENYTTELETSDSEETETPFSDSSDNEDTF
jgi:hypothetical protein